MGNGTDLLPCVCVLVISGRIVCRRDSVRTLPALSDFLSLCTRHAYRLRLLLTCALDGWFDDKMHVVQLSMVSDAPMITLVLFFRPPTNSLLFSFARLYSVLLSHIPLHPLTLFSALGEYDSQPKHVIDRFAGAAAAAVHISSTCVNGKGDGSVAAAASGTADTAGVTAGIFATVHTVLH
jgi:hypothetical protein